RVAGELPFSWSLPGIVPDRPRDLAITIRPQPLDLVNDLVLASAARNGKEPVGPPPFEVTGGTVEGTIQLRGTANVPQNGGTITLRDGQVKLGHGDTSIDNVQGIVEFAGDEVRIRRFAGGSNRSGGFQVTGGIRLGREVNGGPSADLDLGLEINQF